MNADHRKRPSQQELDRDLGTIQKAWNGLDQPDPPDLIDRAVLNLARREMAGRKDSVRQRSPMKWLGAFATVSVVVLALTVTIEQQQQAPVPAPEEADGIRIDRDATATKKDEIRVAPRSSGTSPDKASTRLRQEKAAASPAVRENLQDGPAAFQVQEEGIAAADTWVEELLRLKQSGRTAELAEELAAFRAAYPDYQLPPELVE